MAETLVELEIERDDRDLTVAVTLEWEDADDTGGRGGWLVVDANDAEGVTYTLSSEEEQRAIAKAEAAHADDDLDDYDPGPTDAECDAAARAWAGSRLRDPQE